MESHRDEAELGSNSVVVVISDIAVVVVARGVTPPATPQLFLLVLLGCLGQARRPWLLRRDEHEKTEE
eukprot:3935559-Rhodomonas_salina.1